MKAILLILTCWFLVSPILSAQKNQIDLYPAIVIFLQKYSAQIPVIPEILEENYDSTSVELKKFLDIQDYGGIDIIEIGRHKNHTHFYILTRIDRVHAWCKITLKNRKVKAMSFSSTSGLDKDYLFIYQDRLLGRGIYVNTRIESVKNNLRITSHEFLEQFKAYEDSFFHPKK